MRQRFVSASLLIGLTTASVYGAWCEWSRWYRSGVPPFATFGNFLLYLMDLIPLFFVSWGWVAVARGRSGVFPIVLSALLWIYLSGVAGLFSTPVRFAVLALCIAGLTFGLVVGIRRRKALP